MTDWLGSVVSYGFWSFHDRCGPESKTSNPEVSQSETLGARAEERYKEGQVRSVGRLAARWNWRRKSKRRSVSQRHTEAERITYDGGRRESKQDECRWASWPIERFVGFLERVA
jgi:putative salt-induced outer membrane protein YdiY